MAFGAVATRMQPQIMCLRNMNPYVGAAIADWGGRLGGAPIVPRQLGPAAMYSTSLAGADLLLHKTDRFTAAVLLPCMTATFQHVVFVKPFSPADKIQDTTRLGVEGMALGIA